MSRNGNHHVYTGDVDGWNKARAEQDSDNRCTLADLKGDGIDFGGGLGEGHFWIDDGGDITLYEVE